MRSYHDRTNFEQLCWRACKYKRERKWLHVTVNEQKNKNKFMRFSLYSSLRVSSATYFILDYIYIYSHSIEAKIMSRAEKVLKLSILRIDQIVHSSYRSFAPIHRIIGTPFSSVHNFHLWSVPYRSLWYGFHVWSVRAYKHRFWSVRSDKTNIKNGQQDPSPCTIYRTDQIVLSSYRPFRTWSAVLSAHHLIRTGFISFSDRYPIDRYSNTHLSTADP